MHDAMYNIVKVEALKNHPPAGLITTPDPYCARAHKSMILSNWTQPRTVYFIKTKH